MTLRAIQHRCATRPCSLQSETLVVRRCARPRTSVHWCEHEGSPAQCRFTMRGGAMRFALSDACVAHRAKRRRARL